MKKVRIGIIGCGGIATGKHLPALAKLKDEVSIVAFCDIILEKAVDAKEKYGEPDAKIYDNYKELLKDETIDLVHVLTPNRSHSFITVDALNSGHNVVCEKPMAKTYKEAKEMVDTANKTGKMLTIGYQYRCGKESLYLKRACENDDLGEIYFAKAHATRRRAVPTWGVFLDEFEQGGGPLIDIGTHALDMTLWMMNNYKPKMVVGTTFKKLGNQTQTGNAWGDWDKEKFTVEDSAFGFIVMENGATIELESSWALNIRETLEAKTTLCGTKAGADMSDGLTFNGVEYDRQYLKKPNFDVGGVAFFDAPEQDPSDIEARNYIDALTKGTELRVKPEQALVVTQILEAIYESAKTGKPVYFNED
ncbi:MAG: Gfo/Idh/MocA family oxidoreductase [Oscillospiraceae bacterium]